MKGARTRVLVSVTLAPELVAEVEAWRASIVVPPTKSAAVAYLLRRGLAGVASDEEIASVMRTTYLPPDPPSVEEVQRAIPGLSGSWEP